MSIRVKESRMEKVVGMNIIITDSSTMSFFNTVYWPPGACLTERTWESTDEQLVMKVKRWWREKVGDSGGIDAQCETTISHDGVNRVPTVVTETELTGLWLQYVDVTRFYHGPHQLSTHHTTDRTHRTVTPVWGCHEVLPPSIFRSKSGKYEPTLKSMVKNKWNCVLLAETYDERGNWYSADVSPFLRTSQ